MASWRENTSQQAQDDFDDLLNFCLPLAEGHLAKLRALAPFHGVVGIDGKQALGMVEPGETNGARILELHRSALRSQRAQNRASALVYDTRLPELSTDAVQLDLEHSDGAVLTIHVPYAYVGLRRKFTPGTMRVSLGTPQIWTDV